MEEKEIINTNGAPQVNDSNNKKKATINTLILIAICLVLAGVVCVFALKDSLFKTNTGNNGGSNTTNTTPAEVKSSYRLDGNGLNNFDLAFLQLENNGENKVYSPLSIKYALEMLAEGADGDTKTQLDAIIGDYVARKYTNSKNMSFANAMFIKNSYKDYVLGDYTNKLQSKYNAEVKYDSFSSAKTINDWVKNKTLDIIPEIIGDETVQSLDYALINALAIDMEWKKQIQSTSSFFSVGFNHEEFDIGDDYKHTGAYVSALDIYNYGKLDFEGTDYKTQTVHISAVANKYDIISELGEDSIRSTVQAEYDKWKKSADKYQLERDDFNIDNYIKEIKENYKKWGTSTDFSYYDDDNVKAFAKDLKTYDGLTLQYIGIMPKETKLTDYIKNTNASAINTIISKLKELNYENCEDGYVTLVDGQIPLFKYDYNLSLMNDLKELGIKDVFDKEKANLSKMTKESSYITTAVHNANIDFSNDGIKAAAVTSLGGAGAIGPSFDYNFEIPVKYIDLTFNKPFIYIIRDRDTGEVWFAGTVYEPTEYTDELNKVLQDW